MSASNKSVKSFLLTGSIVAGSLLGINSAAANSSALFNFSELGSGAIVRNALLKSTSSEEVSLEMKCGNDAKKDKSSDKTKDAKCGENTKKDQSKMKDAKCGSGKCGNKTDSMKVKSGKIDDKKHEDKTKEGKCGDGKCGN